MQVHTTEKLKTVRVDRDAIRHTSVYASHHSMHAQCLVLVSCTKKRTVRPYGRTVERTAALPVRGRGRAPAEQRGDRQTPRQGRTDCLFRAAAVEYRTADLRGVDFLDSVREEGLDRGDGDAGDEGQEAVYGGP